MKFFLFALGCKVNGYENNALRERFLLEGYVETKDAKEGDIIVINTCGVTSVADQKSRQHIRKFRRLAPNAVLAVMGCYSEANAEEVKTMGADIVVGTSSRLKIVSYFQMLKTKQISSPIVDVKKSVRQERFEEMGQIAVSSWARAYLKIQDGCDNFCSYCLIPTLRGNSRSREKESTLLETKNLVKQGYKEIVLTGIHIGKYGLDLGDGSYDLGALVSDMLSQNPSLYRLRLGSLESKEVTPKIISIYKNNPALVSHLHVPLQSGSSSVLERMHRPYDTDAFFKTIEAVREVRPDVAITTDLIVGFPGESEEEWKETLRFVKKVRFSEIHVFPYSARKGTLAASLKDQIDPKVKERRVQELLALSKELRKEYESQFYEKEMDVLFEEYKDGYAYGHTSNYLLVKIPSRRSLNGEVLKVEYTESTAAD